MASAEDSSRSLRGRWLTAALQRGINLAFKLMGRLQKPHEVPTQLEESR